MRALDEAEVRRLPFSLETEAALIGAVLLNSDAFARTVDIVTAEMFHEEVHRRTWRVIAGLVEKGQPVKPSSLVTYLGDTDLGGGTTTKKYLADLALDGASVAAAPEHAKLVRDLWVRRKTISTCQDIEAHAYDAPVETPAEAFFGEIETALDELRPAAGRSSEFQTFDAAMDAAAALASHAYKHAGSVQGLSTGLPNLDDALGGLHPGNLIIVGGRPGMAKSSLATNIALAVARVVQAEDRKREIVGLFSLEMTAEEIAQRILSDISNVPFFRLRKGIASESDMDAYFEAKRQLAGLPLHVDPTSGLSIAALRTRARTLKKRHGLSLLIVDYLQLLSGSGKASNNRVNEITDITTGLKALAKELQVPVIALSQLSREVEKRDPPRPQLADLRESGSIEQDADVVMLLYREDYYVKKAEPNAGTEAHLNWECRHAQVKGIADIIIAKNRHGPDATVRLGFDAAHTRFLNEPVPREPEADEPIRERGGKPKAPWNPPADALRMLGILKSLTITRAVEGVKIEDMPRDAKPVPFDVFKERALSELLLPDHSTAEATAFMRNGTKALRFPEDDSPAFIGMGRDQPAEGEPHAWYFWLTARGQRV